MTKRSKIFAIAVALIAVLIIFWIWSGIAVGVLKTNYLAKASEIIYDRNGELIQLSQNTDGFYSLYGALPDSIANLLIAKEDKYFYYHFGINPVSTVRAVFGKFIGASDTSSTITQQLVKILLNHESERTIKNKIEEMFYAVALELHSSKEDVLEMYGNSIYFGNQVQGVSLAAKLYFNVAPDNLTESQIIQLLATISSPSNTNPFMDANANEAFALQNKLQKHLKSEQSEFKNFTESQKDELKKTFKDYVVTNITFEVNSLHLCNESFTQQICKLTLDLKLNEKIRNIVQERLAQFYGSNADNAAVVVFKEPGHQLIAIVGSPDPVSMNAGYQINMAVENRPIGSTVKPFLYGLGFEKNLRPYSLVDDREYKFTTGSGFAHYPKNYDYKYRGIVTLHESLSNSLNVPAVKVLEFVGLDDFYKFLTDRLEFKPVQPLETYQYGIALGQLEMTLLQLTDYFSIFANSGYLHPAKFTNDDSFNQQTKDFSHDKQILDEKYIQLVNKITTDRDASADQFGIEGNLRVEGAVLGVKTGTSREYHDSWTVGYNSDFVVGVWVGNAKNLAMTDISGQTGAGAIWHDTVTLLLDSNYNKKTPFKFDQIKSFQLNDSIYFGLIDDKPSDHINLMLNEPLILSPHSGDTLLFKNDMSIALHASEIVSWYIDDKFLTKSTDAEFKPKSPGQLKITATSISSEISESSNPSTETITINIAP